MMLLPAIDLMSGCCVRLAQGDFAAKTTYATDPAAALIAFADAGAAEAHLVDLDGARARAPRQHRLLADLARTSPLTLQVAGGFRTSDQIAEVLAAGVGRVMVGSLALDDPDAFASLLDRFGPDRLALALDVRLDDHVPIVATHGWMTDSGQSLECVLSKFPSVRHLLVTDIARDGMLAGPNIALMRGIAERYPSVSLQASGGVAALDDLVALRAAGVARVIVGKAIWEGRFPLEEGLAHARG